MSEWSVFTTNWMELAHLNYIIENDSFCLKTSKESPFFINGNDTIDAIEYVNKRWILFQNALIAIGKFSNRFAHRYIEEKFIDIIPVWIVNKADVTIVRIVYTNNESNRHFVCF